MGSPSKASKLRQHQPMRPFLAQLVMFYLFAKTGAMDGIAKVLNNTMGKSAGGPGEYTEGPDSIQAERSEKAITGQRPPVDNMTAIGADGNFKIRPGLCMPFMTTFAAEYQCLNPYASLANLWAGGLH
jgi:hypothetical protein